MSHFTVCVITDDEPTEEVIAEILQPWHEYECTGVEDQYVVDVGVTDSLVADHAKYGDGSDFDEFVSGWTSATKRGERWYRHTNPNAKWDWWTIGGRWTGLLKMKQPESAIVGHTAWCAEPAEHGYGDIAQKSNIDFSAMEKPFTTFAFVKDGQWVQKGEMGWFGCARDEMDKQDWSEAFSSMIDSLPDTAWLTIVDCHI